MKKLRFILSFLVLFVLILSQGSCRDDFETTPSSGNLEFSKDTVYLDTVFTNIGSSTYRLKVYNRGSNLINIPRLELARGEQSQYRLNVDGRPGKVFNDVEILPRDSIFIFIETTIDYNRLQADSSAFLYTDRIVFDSGTREQQIPLITLVKDAVFLYPDRDALGIKERIDLGVNEDGETISLNGFYLNDEQLNFTNDKAYVIYGYAGVPEGKTLRIDAGARVYFHEESGILVTDNASLQVNGALSQDSTVLENEVLFSADRLEPLYSDIPGQWGTIWLMAGSKNNRISHTTIKNATVGLRIDEDLEGSFPMLELNNTQIYNSASVGILAENTSINGENLVINNSGLSSMQLRRGGNYLFRHATIVNFWQESFRQAAALQIDNFNEIEASDLTRAQFINCIIDGNRSSELELFSADDAEFNFSFSNGLIKFNASTETSATTTLYDFENTDRYRGIILNGNADFQNPEQNDLRIGEASDANNAANIETARQVPLDILGTDRTTDPDAGAYESKLFDQE